MAAAGLAGLALGVVASGGRNTLVKLMALGGAAYAGKRLFRNQPPPSGSQRQLPPQTRIHSFDPLNAPPVPTPEALSPFPKPARPEPQRFEGAARSNVAPPQLASHLASAAMDSPPTKGSSDHPTPAPSGPPSTEVESPSADLTGVILTLRGSIHAREAVRLTRPLLISTASHDSPEPESPPARLASDSVPAPQPSSPAAGPWLAPPAVSESETVPDQPAQTAPADAFSEPGPWIGSPQPLSQPELREQAADGVPWLDLPPPSSLDRSSSLRQLAQAAAQLRSTPTAGEPRTPPPSLPQILPPPDSSAFAAEEDEVSVVELPDEDEAAEEPSSAEHSPFSITSQSQSPAQNAGDRLTSFQSRQRTQLPPPRSASSGPFRPTAPVEAHGTSDPGSPSLERSRSNEANPVVPRHPYAGQAPPPAHPASRPQPKKTTPPTVRRTFRRARLRLFTVAASLLAGAIALYTWNRFQSGLLSNSPNPEAALRSPTPLRAPIENASAGPAGTDENSAPESAALLDPASPPLSAADALQSFLDAASPEERILACLPAPELAERMRLYPDQSPVGSAVAGFRLLSTSTAAETNRQRLTFELRLRESSRVFPAYVQNTGEGFGVDWQACIQFKDSLLRRFCEGSFDLWNDLYVILQRGHNYEDESANETLHWFILSSPGSPGFDQRVFVERDSELGRELNSRFEFQKEYQVVAVLDRLTGEGGQPVMRLSGIARFHWEL